MVSIVILGILLIVVGLIIAGIIFFVIWRDEKKMVDRDKDILDS